MPVSATLVACIRFFVLVGNEMAESEVYRRRNGVQSRGQHAPQSGIKVGGLEHEEASSLCWQRAVASLERLIYSSWPVAVECRWHSRTA